jgi:hypothetical protein
LRFGHFLVVPSPQKWAAVASDMRARRPQSTGVGSVIINETKPRTRSFVQQAQLKDPLESQAADVYVPFAFYGVVCCFTEIRSNDESQLDPPLGRFTKGMHHLSVTPEVIAAAAGNNKDTLFSTFQVLYESFLAFGGCIFTFNAKTQRYPPMRSERAGC